jgi:hypothetical protein
MNSKLLYQAKTSRIYSNFVIVIVYYLLYDILNISDTGM